MLKVRELITQLERADPDASVLYLELYADACDAVPVEDVFVDQRHWLRFGDRLPAKAEYFRPKIDEDVKRTLT